MDKVEYWARKVEIGEEKMVTPCSRELIQITQVALGSADLTDGLVVTIFMQEFHYAKHVVGILTKDEPDIKLDLKLHRKTILSHDWKHGSVHFIGVSATGKEIKTTPKLFG